MLSHYKVRTLIPVSECGMSVACTVCKMVIPQYGDDVGEEVEDVICTMCGEITPGYGVMYECLECYNIVCGKCIDDNGVCTSHINGSADDCE